MEALKILQTILGIVGILTTLLFIPIYKLVKKNMALRIANADGCLALLHSKLYARCQEIICEGTISTQELEEIEALYEAYHGLGGNGTGTKLYEEAIGQPLNPKKQLCRK